MKKHLRYILPGLCFIFSQGKISAQNFIQRPEFIKANSNWVFGDSSGIDFNTNPPLSLETATDAPEGGVAVSDTATGQLLFYANGDNCWNRNHELMPNGFDLSGGAVGTVANGETVMSARSSAQANCVVPVLGQPGKYYLFSLQNYSFGSTNPQLYYSIVDMSLEGGLGDIAAGQKNILVNAGPLQEGMIAIPGNNCDVWLLVHKYHEPLFYAYHITEAGIDPTPVQSTTSSSLGGISAAYEMGTMAVSPDRSKIAITSYSAFCILLGLAPALGGVQVAEFDPSSGLITNDLKINDSIAAYSVSFSPDNSRLYVQGMADDGTVAYTLGTGGRVQILQYDMSTYTAAAISASKTAIYDVDADDAGEQFHGLRSNGTVIIQGDMKYIAAPNLSGAACNFQAGPFIALYSTSAADNYGLGNDVIYPLPPDTLYHQLLDTATCYGDAVQLNALPGFEAYQWDDGSTGSSRVVTEPGRYWVFSRDACHSRIDTFVLGVKADARVSLGNDTTLCKQQPFLLHAKAKQGTTLRWQDGSSNSTLKVYNNGIYTVTATLAGCAYTDSIRVSFDDLEQKLGPDTFLCIGDPVQLMLQAYVPPGSSVLWSTGHTGPQLVLNDTGTYWVRVQDTVCNGSDTITVGREYCSCFFDVPNAFSPNADGLNDIFLGSIEFQCPVSAFSMSIYNRWGQRIFYSADPHKGWDGMQSGVPSEVGSYTYEIRFKGGNRKKETYRKGDVTLLR